MGLEAAMAFVAIASAADKDACACGVFASPLGIVSNQLGARQPLLGDGPVAEPRPSGKASARTEVPDALTLLPPAPIEFVGEPDGLGAGVQPEIACSRSGIGPKSGCCRVASISCWSSSLNHTFSAASAEALP